MDRAKLSGMVLNERKLIIDLYSATFLWLSYQFLLQDQKTSIFPENAQKTLIFGTKYL